VCWSRAEHQRYTVTTAGSVRVPLLHGDDQPAALEDDTAAAPEEETAAAEEDAAAAGWRDESLLFCALDQRW